MPGASEALRGKRVIMLHVCLEMGGAERQSLHLARYLQEHGPSRRSDIQSEPEVPSFARGTIGNALSRLLKKGVVCRVDDSRTSGALGLYALASESPGETLTLNTFTPP